LVAAYLPWQAVRARGGPTEKTRQCLIPQDSTACLGFAHVHGAFQTLTGSTDHRGARLGLLVNVPLVSNFASVRTTEIRRPWTGSE